MRLGVTWSLPQHLPGQAGIGLHITVWVRKLPTSLSRVVALKIGITISTPNTKVALAQKQPSPFILLAQHKM